MPGVTAYTATGSTLSVASGRLSYTFGLRGLAVTVDTACSSSLVSLHIAFNSLLLGQTTRAVNSGINLMLAVETPAAFHKSGMLAADGRCKTLDAAADGYVRAEAGGALLLAAVRSTAEAALGVVRGSAVNQDGRSSTLTAPNGPAQQAAVCAALSLARLAFAELSAMQMHGTGTSLGDPIEVGSLAALQQEGRRAAAAPLVLLAGKSLIGHSEPAAGVMGVAHAQMAVALHASLPVLHLRSANPYVAGAMHSGTWSLPRAAGALPTQQDAPISGISSFAFQGTNAHALLQAAPGTAGVSRPAGATWQCSSHWVLPPMFDLLAAVNTGRQLAVFQASLLHPRAAYLQQAHYQGVPILTLGTLLELAAEAIAQLLPAEAQPLMLASVAMLPVAVSHSVPAVLQLAAHPAAGSFELFHLSSSSSMACGSGKAGQAGSRPAGAAAAASPTTTQAAWLPSLQGVGHLTDSAIAIIQEAVCQKQNMAVGPTRVAGALPLATVSMANSVDQVLLFNSVDSAYEPAFASTTGSSSVVSLISSDISNVHLVGVGSKAQVVPGMQATSAATVPSEVEQPVGLLYSTMWVADAPAVAPTLVGVGSSSGALVHSDSTAAALSLVQQAAAGGHAISALLPVSQHPAPHPCGMTRSAAAPALHGMLKALVQESPALAVSVIASDAAKDGWALGLGGSVSTASDAHGTVVQARASFAPRLLALPPTSSGTGRPRPSRLTGGYVVTGGSGVLGGHVALWLLGSGADSVLLLSRSGALSGTVLQQAGITVQLAAAKADLGAKSDLAGLPVAGLSGILHSGGVLADATLAKQTSQSLCEVGVS